MTSPSHHKKETKSKHLRNQLLILMLLIGVLIVLLLVSLALGGNSNDSGTSDDTTSGKTNVETSTAALTESLYSLPGDFLDGYEAANYDKFNSFASENGLGGTLIYFTGSMGEIEIIPTEESGDVYYSVVTIPDGRQWLCALNLALFTDKDYYSDLVGCSAVFCGIYEGYSGTENKPVLYLSKLFVPDTGEIKNGIGSILLLPDDEPSTTDPTSVPVKETEPSITVTESQPTTSTKESSEQRNAVKKAKSYLNVSAFSREGLIDQLEYDGFSHEDAIYGADHCGADWYEQAIKKATSYLDVGAFSREGLIDQLEYDHFTHDQAVHGVDSCGADWYAQAAKKASSYINIFSFSRSELIDQLEYEKFTHDQAVYGADQSGY